MKRIALTQGKFALVDDKDYEWLNQWKWRANYNKFVRSWDISRIEITNGKRKQISMSRQIMGFPKNMEVDHVNHNRFDNQRNNLRVCTHKQNMFNRRPIKTSRSKYKGVAWHKHNKMWQATISVDNKCVHLGYFQDEVKAAKEYDRAAEKHQGKFAYLNFPGSQPRR